MDLVLAEWTPVYATDMPVREVWRVLASFATKHGGTLQLCGELVGVVDIPLPPLPSSLLCRRPRLQCQRVRVTLSELDGGPPVLLWLEACRLGHYDSYLCSSIAGELRARKPPAPLLALPRRR